MLLIVDDEEAARHGMRRALETFGCDIAEAESAETARACMHERRFDLLLLDVNLPGLSGLEFLKEVQEQSEQQKTEAPLIVIVTAHGSERLAVQAVKSGAYDYISKPFELDDLRLVVKTAFENIQLRRENRSLRPVSDDGLRTQEPVDRGARFSVDDGHGLNHSGSKGFSPAMMAVGFCPTPV